MGRDFLPLKVKIPFIINIITIKSFTQLKFQSWNLTPLDDSRPNLLFECINMYFK